MVALSALYKTILAVATPLLKFNPVSIPKLEPATVGTVTGLGELAAPENVILCVPVYPVSVFPLTSLAVTVMVCAPPAVCVPVPVITNLVAVPGFTVMLVLVTAVPVAGVKVKVPALEVPVKVKPKLVRFATPLVKSPAWFSTLFPPDPNPLILPVKLVLTVILLPDGLKLVTVFP
ncbi:hypothetical protein AQBE111736_13875 [Aquirufa beregesia]